jgi:hypothetical protein
MLENKYDYHGYEFIGTTTQPRVSYPRLHIVPPFVPDETGYMRFRYIARMSAETHIKLHLLPEYANPLYPKYWLRQIVFLPFLQSDGKDEQRISVPCIPYELSMH